jgi:hypothetical protein
MTKVKTFKFIIWVVKKINWASYLNFYVFYKNEVLI